MIYTTAWDVLYIHIRLMRNLELYVSMYQSKLRIFKGSAAENFKEFGDHYDNQWINLMFMYMENFEN